MTAWAARRISPAAPRTALAALATAAGALAFGAAFAASAFLFSPLLLPVACAAVVLAVFTVARPEIGIAAAFPLVIAGNLGVVSGPPWAPGLAWSLFLFALAVVRKPETAHGRGRAPRLGLALAAYLAATVVGLVVTSDATAALPVLRSTATGALLFFATATLVRKRRQVSWVLAGIAASAVLISGLAIYQYRSGNLDVGFITATEELVGRATAGFGSPNTLGGFLLVLVPFLATGALAYRRARPLHVVALAIAVLGIYFSFSRGALIALGIVPLIFLGWKRAAIVTPLLLVLVLVSAPGLARERFGSLTTQGSEVTTRVDFWQAGWTIWTDHPLLGVGPGGFPHAYSSTKSPGKGFLPASIFEPPPHAHNLFLNLLAEQGLIGLIAFLFVAAAAARACLEVRRDRRRWVAAVGTAGLAMLAAGAVHNIFDVTVLEQPGIFFWALLGLISAACAIAGEQELEA